MNRLLRLIAIISSSLLPAAVRGEEVSEYFQACSGGLTHIIKHLLDETPALVHSVTDEGEHCLHLAAAAGNVEVARVVLHRGGDANVREPHLRTHPLSWSAYHGQHEMAALLVAYGADANADFDSRRREEDGAPAKLTVLDVVEGVLAGMTEEYRKEMEEEEKREEETKEEEKEREKKETARNEQKSNFVKLRNVLVQAGAKRNDRSAGASKYAGEL